MSAQTYTATQVLQSTALFGELVHLLDLSFSDDPLTNWLYKKYSRQEYLKRLTYYHRYLLRVALRCGASSIVIEANDQSASTQELIESPPLRSNMKALAVLIPPSGNTTFDSSFVHLRSGLLSFAWYGGFSAMSNFLFGFVPKLDAMIAEMYPAPNEHKKNDQWHLLFMGTRPDVQGQGLGTRLLLECQRVVTEAIQQDKLSGKEVGPLYLEATSLNSKRLYNRMGFVDRTEATYGKCKEGEAATTGEDGKIIGGRLFAMNWLP